MKKSLFAIVFLILACQTQTKTNQRFAFELDDLRLSKGKIMERKVSLAEEIKKKKIVILNFWATWCAACMAEIPEIVRFYEQADKSRIEILALNMDEGIREIFFPQDEKQKNKIKEVMKRHQMTFPVLLKSFHAARQNGVMFIPRTIVIKKGQVAGEFGSVQNWAEEIKKHL